MTKHKPTSANKQYQKKRRPAKSAAVKQRNTYAGPAQLTTEADTLANGQPPETQATRLDDGQLQTAQRHALFIALQQRVGHQAVQQMVMKREQPKEPLAISPVSKSVIQLRHARGLVSSEVREIRRRMAWFKKRLDQLEAQRAITTEEADNWRSGVSSILEETRSLSVRREASRAEARQLWLGGRRLLKRAKAVREIRNRLRRRAERGRSTQGLRMISDFQITPPVIRVEEGEATRISFVLKKRARDISWFILSHEGGGDVATSHRLFTVSDLEPGYKYAVWDGTFIGSRNRPPESGTYRVNLWVTDEAGRTERVFDQIRVENPAEETVLPRVASGLALKSLTFDGAVAVLTDERGNEIRARAVSGLRPNNPRNRRHLDYTQSRYQGEQNMGPIPEGSYIIHGNQVQHPEMKRDRLQYSPTGASARAWGPFRAELHPDSGTDTKGRSEFFLHLDVTADGTAGCIGIQPGDEGKFNQIMSLISLSGGDLPVTVNYPQGAP
jgi:hypothetical protein